MLDMIIRGGQVVTPSGVGAWDVAVSGEKIAAVAEPGTLTDDVGRVVDASGKIVVPGGIEPHAHIAAPVALMSGVETAPPDQVSRAALFGGTTTLTDFAVQEPGVDIPGAFAERASRWQGSSYCDYSHHCMLLGPTPTNVLGQIREAVQEGFPTIKIFTTNVRPVSKMSVEERRLVGMGHLSAIMEEVKGAGGMVFVHSEDDDIVQFMYSKLQEEERTEHHRLYEVHNNMSEDISFRRVLKLAEWTGAAVYFVHVSAKEGVNAIREFRGKGLPIYGETLHNYVTFNAENYKEPDGMKYHTYPSLKSEDDRLALWDGLIKGGVNCMATDEYCTDLATKLAGQTVFDVTGGHSGAETRVGIAYSEGVAKRGMGLERFVEVTSSNAAKIMGYYPRKGAIAPGSDADIVLIDPDVRKKLTMADLHISDYSIWDGWDIQGWPTSTILRGKVVVENGQFYGQLGDGQLVKRKIAASVVERPAC